jgi:hypothetical protein
VELSILDEDAAVAEEAELDGNLSYGFVESLGTGRGSSHAVLVSVGGLGTKVVVAVIRVSRCQMRWV